MKILAIDSSALVASVAVCEDEAVLAEYTVNNGNTHSETLLPMVENMLNTLSMKAKDIDVFAVSEGPGSFTGVRIGVSTVKGLAFGSGKPCVGVSTLEALANNIKSCKGIICPVMNARHSQLYTAVFSSNGETLTRLLPDSALSVSELDELLSTYEESVYLCGDGYDIAVEAFEKTEVAFVPNRLRLQSAASVATVALEKYNSGESVTDTQLGVTYLRPSQAERERAEREEKGLQN